MIRARLWAAEAFHLYWPDTSRVLNKLRAAAPALLFGVRMWLAVCLALYVAFWLELDNAIWAGTSAAIMCQPTLGASLRKGWYRVIGTIIGAMAIVVLTAFTVQDRFGFLIGMAVWGAICGMIATLLRNFAAYAAALAGYTAVIIAADELGATGGASGNDVFMLAVSRASEISIGIVCAGIVLAATDFGGARRKLTLHFAAIASDITGRISNTFLQSRAELAETRVVRRDLLRRVIALDPVIDEAIGESSELRYHSPILHAAVGGLLSALAAWRVVAVHLELMPTERERREAERIRSLLPDELRSPSVAGDPAWWADPQRVRGVCEVAARSLTNWPERAPSLRLLADRLAEAALGIQRAANGLLLIKDPGRAAPFAVKSMFVIPDVLPALVNAARILVTMIVMEALWIVTAWPNGAQALTFAAVVVILFSPQAERAYGVALGFLIGTVMASVVAAIVAFAVLPTIDSYVAFSLVLALVFIPAGALMTVPSQMAAFTGVTINFIPLVSPSNPMVYNIEQFYNTSAGLTAGVAAGVMAFRLIPPLSPAFRTRWLLKLTLRDLRHLAARPSWRSTTRWENHGIGRLSQLPDQTDPLQRSQLLAAVTIGTQIIRLSHVAERFSMTAELHPALAAVADGDCAGAREHFSAFDRALAAVPATLPGERVRARARGRILAVSEALMQHCEYFDANPPRGAVP